MYGRTNYYLYSRMMLIVLSSLGVSSMVEYKLIAALTVIPVSWKRYKGKISSVPPAKSIREGALLIIESSLS